MGAGLSEGLDYSVIPLYINEPRSVPFVIVHLGAVSAAHKRQ
jgi:hypothetical protein